MKTNSALEWLPKIIEAGIKTPKTQFIPYDHNDIVCMLEGGKSKTINKLWKIVFETCNKQGFPAFIRTDLASAKHGGISSYLITRNEDIGRVIWRTVEDNELKFWIGDEHPKALMIREFLQLETAFIAFHGLPISKEWRYFANEKEVICHHPYWPKFAIKFFEEAPEIKGWQKKLNDLYKIDYYDILAPIAIQAAKVCGDNCSVDFAMDINNNWWLIDMAKAENSWHWLNCDKIGELIIKQ